MSPTTALLIIFLTAAVAEVYGLIATVSTYLREDPENEGLYVLEQANSTWQKVRGPLFIVLGVLIGLGGNIAGLYVGR
ncbi:hypothetical protein GS482_21320 [Rhodococcus hoagii]|nr:hypothetical protein [Prescottella equi]